MKFIISPAKTLKVQPTPFIPTTPQSHSLTARLLKKLKQLKLDQYESIFSTSQKLSQQIYTSTQLDIIHPAIFYYYGEAFKSLQINDMNNENIQYMQKHVYIYSALYGLLRPLDGIQFYRLDFLTPIEKLGISKGYAIIKNEVTNRLISEDNDTIVLLCSQEYKDMIDLKRTQEYKTIIDVSFISVTNGKEKTVSVHAKQARGLFLKQCIQESVTSLEDLFNIVSFCDWQIDIESSTPTHRVYKKVF